MTDFTAVVKVAPIMMKSKIFKFLFAFVALFAVVGGALFLAFPFHSESQAQPQPEAVRPRTQIDILGDFDVPDPDKPDVSCGIARFYKKGGFISAKMVAVYHNGKIDDTEKNPLERTKGVPGNPFVCGFDFINNLALDGGKYVGSVIDPDTNRTYRCLVWFDVKKNRLVVRGEFLFFGLNQYWTPSTR